ncbi:MAG: 4-hydroxybenzoate polyprenyltransferase [Bradymonadia bacterium]|jgi:4-hydroxybenzoate polyprenyltransferase
MTGREAPADATAGWTMRQLIVAVRPKMAVFAVGILAMAAASFNAQWSATWVLVGLCVSVLVSAIVVTNDWFDREHDRAKGRMLATRAPAVFARFTLALWGVGGALIAILGSLNATVGALLSAMAVLGATYSWARRCPLLSGIMVSLSYALLVLVAGAVSPQVSAAHIWPLSAAIFAFVYGRETVSDLADRNIDIGYKATIPVVFGAAVGRSAAIALFVTAILLAAWVQPWGAVFAPLTVSLAIELRRPKIDFARAYTLADTQTIGFMVLLSALS